MVKLIISKAAADNVPKKAAPNEPYIQGNLLPYLFEIGPERREPKNIETNIDDAYLLLLIIN